MANRDQWIDLCLWQIEGSDTAELAYKNAITYLKGNQGYRAREVLYVVEPFLIPDHPEWLENLQRIVKNLEV
jgi:hypothetical protein